MIYILFVSSFRKTIVHGGSKFSSGEANRVLESMLDQENVKDSVADQVPLSSVTNTSEVPKTNTENVVKSSKNADSKQNGKKGNNQSKKRPLEEGTQSSQPQKKKKQEQSKTCRRKLLPPVKGQKPISQFFRI